MIKRETVIVLGAGASCPFGFPTGKELLKTICGKINNQNSTFVDILSRCGYNDLQRKEFSKELELSMQPSVDAFLEKRPEYIEIGKLSIAASLIPHEHPGNIMSRKDKNWYEYLFQKLELTPENYSDNKITFITFNYDRSLTYFFFRAFKHSFGLSDSDAGKIAKDLEPIHVYGKLGELSEVHGEGRPYTPQLITHLVKLAAESIHILSEEEKTTSELQRAREAIKKAEIIIFLGFGYHPINIDRLAIPGGNKKIVLCGSAYGIEEGERPVIKNHFLHKIYLGNEFHDILDFLRKEPFLAWSQGINVDLPNS